MLFGNEVIDLIKIRKSAVSPSRLLDLKEKLITRNEESLNIASDAPLFALQDLSAKRKSGSEYIFI
jgi:hypothetical protein